MKNYRQARCCGTCVHGIEKRDSYFCNHDKTYKPLKEWSVFIEYYEWRTSHLISIDGDCDHYTSAAPTVDDMQDTINLGC